MKKCITCQKKLTGRQTKYCSIKCKSTMKNPLYQSYKNQKRKGLEKKLLLIDLSGGKCSKCGYKKNLGALTFHHRNPKTKKFMLDMRSLANRTWKSILIEHKKCDLLCFNCHTEIHHPELILSSLRSIVV